MLSTFIFALGATVVTAQTPYQPVDPCIKATSDYWITATSAHTCELNVAFNKTRSQSVISTVINFLQYYSTENYFIHSPNPRIPSDYNLNTRLQTIYNNVNHSQYKTDWDFTIDVSDALNREHDGHTVFFPSCNYAFSWNLPVSIATLGNSPTEASACPYFLVNYDFPNQVRPGLEDYYKGLGYNYRQYDGLQILKINGQDASDYLVSLAQNQSILQAGLYTGYESVQARYMRLMSRYSADTTPGLYTQEVGRFAQRGFYPNAASITITVELKNGQSRDVYVPWAAHFTGAGNDTASFTSQTCLSAAGRGNVEVVVDASNDIKTRKAVTVDDTQDMMRDIAAKTPAGGNYVTPNLTVYGHITALDIYRLKKHPKVGVAYFSSFEPSDGTSSTAYFNGLKKLLSQALAALKKDGVTHLIIDQSGNRGGYIYGGAIAMWSFWPNDLYPGFPAVFRDLDLARRESDIAATQKNPRSDFFYGDYRDLNYHYLTNNSQFMDPPVPVTINGVPDAFSHPFFDDFGANSSAVTPNTSPPFAAADIVIVANSICGSTCSIFSSYLYQKHGIRSAVFGGLPNQTLEDAQFDGGVKGSEVITLGSRLSNLASVGLQNDPAAPKALPIQATFECNFRNAIPYTNTEDEILEFVFEGATKHFQFTMQNFNNPQAIWEYTADQFWGQK